MFLSSSSCHEALWNLPSCQAAEHKAQFSIDNNLLQNTCIAGGIHSLSILLCGKSWI